MVFLMVSWVVSTSDNIRKHEELERRLIQCYRSLKGVKSFKYFSHWIGHDQSAVGGRLEIFEFENLAALEEFFEELWKNEKAHRILSEKLKLVNPATVRFSLLSERNKELWFEKTD